MTRPAPKPVALLLGLLLSAVAFAAGQEDVDRLRECQFCGMDRKAYGFSRALVRYQDGSEAGTCSLHCALIEQAANPGKVVAVLLVADRESHVLLDASAASWVMGGDKKAVMAARPKWAFATPEAAAAFVRDHGGAQVTWEEALAAAREDVDREAAVAAERRAASARPFGCGTAGAAARAN